MKNKLLFRSFHREYGFTLIELLVVIAIIGILSALLIVNFIGVKARARDAQRKSDVKQIQAALEFYRSDNGGYPDAGTTLPCGSALTSSATTTQYIAKIPCDPSSPTSQQYYANFSNSYSTIVNGTAINVSRNYCVRTCLENTNDRQKDDTNNPSIAACPGLASCTAGTWSYTVQNP